MSEDKKREGTTAKVRRRPRRLWTILLGAVIVTIVCGLAWKAGWLDFRSVDEKLAAIDAELAIPDSENAAVFYRRFFTDPNNAAALDDLHGHTPSAYVEPWTDKERPELTAELKTHRAIIQTLLDISQMREARFPIYPSPNDDSWQMLQGMKRVPRILSSAAANDLAEGRPCAAHSKYRSLLILARHLQQQPAAIYNLVGSAIEGVASGNIRRAVMRDGVTEEQLRSLETILENPPNRNEGDAEIAARVNQLIEEKERSHLPLVERFKQWLLGRGSRKQREHRLRLLRLRLDAVRRATPILIALARHKEETSVWPETLEHIQPKLPGQMLTDPQSGGSFVYYRDEARFIFYSKGPNGIDDGGSYSRPADDWPIWPLNFKIILAPGQ